MEFRIVLIFYYVLLFYQETESSVTVEKGGRAELECPGFVPSPNGDPYAHFNWYKVGRGNNISANNKVATKRDRLNEVSGDLKGRASLDGTTVVLEIPTTRVTDDHYYKCLFHDTDSGTIENGTQLIITVTPKPEDIKIFGSDTVEEGKSVTYICNASEVKPPPQEMYFRFMDSGSQLTTNFTNLTNNDELTSTVSVQYKLVADHTHQGKKLQCVFVTSTNNTIISSEEREIKVLYKPVGTPSILADKESVPVNSTITLTCDTDKVDETITYYLWKSANNGIVIGNTTESTYEYKTTSVGKAYFICISGNKLGTSSESKPLEVEITNIEIEDQGKEKNGGGDPSNSMLPVIIGGCVGAPLLGLAVGYFLWRHKKKKANSRSPQQSNNVEEPPVVYAEVNKNRGARRGVANGGQADAGVDLGGDVYAQPMKKKGGKNKAPQQNGEYGNLELGEGRAMSEDGLIYATPDFAKPPPTGKGKGKNQGAKAPSAQAPPAGQATKTSQPNKHMDYTPVEYGELNFTQMKK